MGAPKHRKQQSKPLGKVQKETSDLRLLLGCAIFELRET